MTSDTTLVRVPSSVRDHVRQIARTRNETFGQVIDRGLDLIDQESFWSQVQTLSPDVAYRDEFAMWDVWGMGANES